MNKKDIKLDKKEIEVELIALRCGYLVWSDPFIAYQEGRISKRKLIELIADCLSEARAFKQDGK